MPPTSAGRGEGSVMSIRGRVADRPDLTVRAEGGALTASRPGKRQSVATYCGAQTHLTFLCSAIYDILPAEKRLAGHAWPNCQHSSRRLIGPERHSPHGQEFRGYAEVREGKHGCHDGIVGSPVEGFPDYRG